MELFASPKLDSLIATARRQAREHSEVGLGYWSAVGASDIAANIDDIVRTIVDGAQLRDVDRVDVDWVDLDYNEIADLDSASFNVRLWEVPVAVSFFERDGSRLELAPSRDVEWATASIAAVYAQVALAAYLGYNDIVEQDEDGDGIRDDVEDLIATFLTRIADTARADRLAARLFPGVNRVFMDLPADADPEIEPLFELDAA